MIFSKFADYPYNKELFCEFVRYVQGADPECIYMQLTKGNKRLANECLSGQNIFTRYSDAVAFIHKSLEAANFKMPEVHWPNLHIETPVRINIDLGKNVYLTVCLYRFYSGNVELVGYVS